MVGDLPILRRSHDFPYAVIFGLSWQHFQKSMGFEMANGLGSFFDTLSSISSKVIGVRGRHEGFC